MKSNFKRPFSDFVKKQTAPIQLAIQDEVDEICIDYSIGEQKSGDLAGFRVHKFKVKTQLYLIAYRPPTDAEIETGKGEIEILVIDFFKVGPHENFYAELKKYLKS